MYSPSAFSGLEISYGSVIRNLNWLPAGRLFSCEIYIVELCMWSVKPSSWFLWNSISFSTISATSPFPGNTIILRPGSSFSFKMNAIMALVFSFTLDHFPWTTSNYQLKTLRNRARNVLRLQTTFCKLNIWATFAKQDETDHSEIVGIFATPWPVPSCFITFNY